MRAETKVGLFALAALFVIGFITLKVGSRSFTLGGGYKVTLTLDNAVGVRHKTPVEIAGIKVGKVKSIKLLESKKANVTLQIDDGVELPPDTKAVLRAKGFLGETLIELIPGSAEGAIIPDGGTIEYAGPAGDVNRMMSQFSSIADDIKAVSTQLREVAGVSKDSPLWHIVNNLESFTATLASNQANFNKIAGNLAELTESLRGTVVKSKENVEDSLRRIASITKKVDEGQGTIGRLVNDDETVTKLNEAVDNLNKTLGGLNKLETEIGYHAEYEAQSEDFKSYVNLTLRPSPDKAFIFDFVQDPRPTPDISERTSNITVGGNTTTVTSNEQTVTRNKFRFSAQLAKKFYDFTIRGGIIESSGGLGMDYNKGPFGASFSAFSFQNSYGQRPQLKAYGTLNVTKNLYLLGGAANMISLVDRPDWFVGAGFRLIDEDIKSLIGLGAAAAVKK